MLSIFVGFSVYSLLSTIAVIWTHSQAGNGGGFELFMLGLSLVSFICAIREGIIWAAHAPVD